MRKFSKHQVVTVSIDNDCENGGICLFVGKITDVYTETRCEFEYKVETLRVLEDAIEFFALPKATVLIRESEIVYAEPLPCPVSLLKGLL